MNFTKKQLIMIAIGSLATLFVAGLIITLLAGPKNIQQESETSKTTSPAVTQPDAPEISPTPAAEIKQVPAVDRLKEYVSAKKTPGLADGAGTPLFELINHENINGTHIFLTITGTDGKNQYVVVDLQKAGLASIVLGPGTYASLGAKDISFLPPDVYNFVNHKLRGDH